jgi:hypothetical protein
LPDNEKLMPPMDEIPYGKAENIDLSDFVMKAHALAGEYFEDVKYNMGELLKGDVEHFIMVMDGKHMKIARIS